MWSPPLLTCTTMFSATDSATLKFMFYTQHQLFFFFLPTNTVLSYYTLLSTAVEQQYILLQHKRLQQFPGDLNTGHFRDCAASMAGITVT